MIHTIWNICILLCYNIPIFFTRFFAAIILHYLEDSNIGRKIYYLPFPRDRNEVVENPMFMIKIIQSNTDIIPKKAMDIQLRLHEADESTIADPDKYLNIFIFTITWQYKEKNDSINICCKSSKFRGPRIAQLYLSGIGFKSREVAFYDNYAPELIQHNNVNVPKCYYNNVFPLLTHTFYLLEAINIDNIVNKPLKDTTKDSLDVELFLKEEARLHAYYMQRHNENKNTINKKFEILHGSIFPSIIKTSKPLKEHSLLLEACFKFAVEHCPCTLLHGDARLGNGILHKNIQRVTLVDFEMCQPGTPLFDVLYCLWLCTDVTMDDSASGNAADDDGNGNNKQSSDMFQIYSKKDWEMINMWEIEMETHTNKYDKSKYAPLKEQVLVVTLLLWAYTWAVGDAGFGKVWQDGNNEDDLKAWGTRIRQRIKKFANDSEAHIVLAHALGMHNASFSHQNEILNQIKSFIEIGIQEKVWTENDQNKNNELISKDDKRKIQ